MLDGTADNVVARVAWTLHATATAIGIEVDIHEFFPDLDPADKDGFIPVFQEQDFTRFIYSQPDELIGLKFGSNVRIEGLGVISLLLRSSSTFGDMLTRANRYHRIINRFSEFNLETRGEALALIFPPTDMSRFGPREQLVMARLSRWVAWGRALCFEHIKPMRVRFKWAGPQNRFPVADFFDCEIDYGSTEDSLLFDASTLRSPLRDSTPELSEDLERYAALLIERMKGGEDFLSRVRIAIEEGFVGGSISESAVASRLAMTTRTLHRKLNKQHSSFRDIRNAVLQERAMALLRQPSISIGEISFMLGYSEPATFCRAFKRWTGKSPGTWRCMPDKTGQRVNLQLC